MGFSKVERSLIFPASNTTMSALAPSCNLPFCRAAGVETLQHLRRHETHLSESIHQRDRSLFVDILGQHARISPGVTGIAFEAVAGDHHQRDSVAIVRFDRCPVTGNLSRPDSRHYFRLAEHPGVIAWWLEPKCRVQPLLRIARFFRAVTVLLLLALD